MAQLAEHLTLDFSSDRHPVVREFEPRVGLRSRGRELAWDSLSLSLSLPLPCSLSQK